MITRALCVLTCLTAGVALAQPGENKKEAANVVEVSLGGSTVVRVPDAGRVTLTDPAIADVSAAGGGLLVIGRKVGETNLIMQGTRVYTYLVKVTLPAQAIQNEVARIFPREDIEVRAVGGALVLLGTVSSSPVVTQVEQVALGYLTSPSIQALGVQPNVINLLEVKGRQQVLLEATFAEVKRSSLREIGVNFFANNEKGTLGVIGGNGPVGNPATGPQFDRAFRDPSLTGNEPAFGSVFFGIKDGAFPFYATLNLLAKTDFARTLAQPKLIALSGQKATFVVGGELPVVISGIGGGSLQFKRFGVRLDFTPTVLSDKTMQLDALVEVSAPDFTRSVLGVPSIVSRSTTTTIQLRDGQGFAIAGLLNEEIANVVRKVPGLGDVPILGVLFSSKEFDRKETELVVVITARLVDPQDADSIPALPGETTISDPSDLELFLLNIQEAKGKERPARMNGGEPSAALPRHRGPVGAVGFWR